MNSFIKQKRLFHQLGWLSGFAIAIFFALFAFVTPFGFMQLIPSLFIIFVLIISLLNDLNGFIGFFILGIVATFFFSTYKEMLNFLLISFPLFITSAFFIKSFFDRKNKTQTT